MKPIKFQTKKLSFSADMKIRFRLCIMKYKNISKSFMLPGVVLSIFSIMFFSYFQNGLSPKEDITRDLASESRILREIYEISEKKQELALKQSIYAQKAQKYQQYAMVRISQVRK